MFVEETHCVFENLAYLGSRTRKDTQKRSHLNVNTGRASISAPLYNTYELIPGGETSDRCSMYEKGFSHSLDLSSIVRVYIEEESHESEEKGNVFNENSCLQAHQKSTLKRNDTQTWRRKVSLVIQI